MTEAETVANGRVTANQVRAARLVADLARTWGVAVPQTLQDIAEADLEPASTNGHAPSSQQRGPQETSDSAE
jgi:hypothetical protein